MIDELFDSELRQVIKESRILAINVKHECINLEHLFVAMLQTDCLAKPFLSYFDPTTHVDWLQAKFPPSGWLTLDDSIPLTLHAERIIRHAAYLASLHQQDANSVHLLLAILSYRNDVSDLIKKKGIIFEDISTTYSGGILPKTPIELKLRRFRKPSQLARFIGLAQSIPSLLEEICQHASNLFDYQQYNYCILTCKTGLELKADHKELKRLLAYSLLFKEEFTDAIVQLQDLMNEFPDELNYPFSLSYCYDQLKNHIQSEAILAALLVKYPNNPFVLNNRGYNLIIQDRFSEAVPFLEKAIELTPSYTHPYDNLGFIKYKLGNAEEAHIQINQALSLDKGNFYAYKSKGMIFFEQGDKESALEQFQLAFKYVNLQTERDEILRQIDQCR